MSPGERQDVKIKEKEAMVDMVSMIAPSGSSGFQKGPNAAPAAAPPGASQNS